LSYQFGGQQKTVTGGRYPEMKLVTAREWREKVNAVVR
jgi:hypothetical protein